MTIRPIGMQGFNSKQEAIDNANSSLVGVEYRVLKRTHREPMERDDYAWVWPVEYAEKLIADGLAVDVTDTSP